MSPHTAASPYVRKARIRQSLHRFAALAAILLLSLAVYEALFWSTLKKEIVDTSVFAARSTAASLAYRIEPGLRYGKALERYPGLEVLLEQAAKSCGMPVAVLSAQGRILLTAGSFPASAGDLVPESCTAGVPVPGGAESSGRQADGAREIAWYSGRLHLVTLHASAGSAAVWVDDDRIAGSLFDRWCGEALPHLFIVVLGLLLFEIVNAFAASRRARSGQWLPVGILSLVILVCGMHSVWSGMTAHTGALTASMRSLSEILSQDLGRLLQAGGRLDRVPDADRFLARAAGIYRDSVRIELLSGSTVLAASGVIEDVPAALSRLAPSFRPLTVSLTSPGTGHAARETAGRSPEHDMSVTGEAPGMAVRLRLSRTVWLAMLFDAVLDVLSIAIVAVVFLMELLTLLGRLAQAGRAAGRGTAAAPGPECAVLLTRPLMFGLLVAVSLPTTFLPLYMDELVDPQHPARLLLLCLPASIQLGAAALSTIAAGGWCSRRGVPVPILTGMMLLAAGSLAAMFSLAPWHYLAASALLGAGFGLVSLALEVVAVRGNHLADMQAGNVAGDMCGLVLGGMLAERFGYAAVFGISGLLLLFVLVLQLPVLRTEWKRPAEAASVPAGFASGGLVRRMRELLGTAGRYACSPGLALLLVCVTLPHYMAEAAVCNFVIPVGLDEAGMEQAGIARIFMLNCLVFIFFTPRLSRLFERRGRLVRPAMCLGGLLSGAALAGFVLLPVLPGSLLLMTVLGLTTAIAVPAQSMHLFALPAAAGLGTSATMSVLSTSRTGACFVGPLGVGALAIMMDAQFLMPICGFVLAGL
ncbi:MAG: MFS transporter, partial [Desulfovibrionaceae bacterium]|nr:MFS transporter [Desulfovibrionaceae bacterium]